MVVGLGNLPSEVQGKPSLVEYMSHLWTFSWLPESVLEEGLLPCCLPIDRCCMLLVNGHCKYTVPTARAWPEKKKKNIGTKRANLFFLQCPLLTKLTFVPARKILKSPASTVQGRQWRVNLELKDSRWHGDGVYDSGELSYQETLSVILGSSLFAYLFLLLLIPLKCLVTKYYFLQSRIFSIDFYHFHKIKV